ncbi:MAG: hypothetical protein KKB59_18525 [Spirochaetes bacterium]|nr:hypothetical protein [Spirochaetota bacterium]
MSDEMNVAAEAMDRWIKITDAVMDRELRPEYSLTAFEWGVKALGQIVKYDGLWEKLEPQILALCIGAREDSEYVPGKYTPEQDIQAWELKAGRLSVEFTFVCFEHPELDTPDNWTWIKEVQEFGLKLNDCSDILRDKFEDMIQVRRNWVVMKLDNDIFINWRKKIPKIKDEAQDVLAYMTLSEPPEPKLRRAYEVFVGQRKELMEV